jgi:predicted transcriptional regulator
VQRLEAEGVATNDLWEDAIESSLSFANAGELVFGDYPK